MRPTEMLSAEHRVIEQVLDALDALVRDARADGTIDTVHAADALAFLRCFADRAHHGKEEERLFPLLVARGLPRHVGPIAVMLDDHAAGRELLARMEGALERRDVDAFAAAAGSYTALLREHVRKEDGVLFPMAESMLDSRARASLQEAFEALDRADAGRARALASADALARRFGVALAAERAPAPADGPLA